MPHLWYPLLHVRLHEVPSQLAVPFGSVAQGRQLVPQLVTSLALQTPEQAR